MTTFLFLRITHDLSELPRDSGDARRAAHSSVRSDPAAGSSCLRRFARPRYRTDRDTLSNLLTGPRVSVPIDVHGSLDRVKDVSSFGEALVRRLPDECVRKFAPHADYVPLLLLPEGTCCRRCDRLRGNEPQRERFGPTETHVLPTAREGWRHPVRRGAFHRCVTGTPKDCSSCTRDGLSLTPPTRSPHG